MNGILSRALVVLMLAGPLAGSALAQNQGEQGQRPGGERREGERRQRVREGREQMGQGQPGERRPGGGEGRGEGRGPGGMRGGIGMGGMFGGGEDAMISSPELKRYADRLQLTDDQRAAAKALHDGYRAEMRAIDDGVGEKRREAMEKFREERDPAVFDGMRAAATEAAAQRKKVEAGFFSDVKSLLSQDQEAKWTGVERMHRRESGLRRGRLSGERMDVVRLVEGLELDAAQQEAVQPILESYEQELDKDLEARNKVYEDVQGKVGELMRAQDMDAAQKELERAREAGLKVREINRKYARQVQEALPAEQKAAMAAAVKKAAHPEIYRDSQTSRQLEAAGKLSDLDETQQKAIAELREKHARELGGVNDKLATTAEEVEMTFNLRDMAGRFRDGEQGPAADLREQRRDLESGAREALKKILTPEQFEQLPKPQRREFEGGRRGQRGEEAESEEL